MLIIINSSCQKQTVANSNYICLSTGSLRSITTFWYQITEYVHVEGFIYNQTSSSLHRQSLHYFQGCCLMTSRAKCLWYKLLCAIYSAIPSIWVVSSGSVVACPTPPLFHQNPVSAEESEKQRQQEIVQEKKPSSPKLDYRCFSVAKTSYELLHRGENSCAFGFQIKAKGNVVKDSLLGKLTWDVSIVVYHNGCVRGCMGG